MFSFRLRNQDHSRRFVIAGGGSAGWEVREELDSRTIRLARYLDWHRVERAHQQVEGEIRGLLSRGWIEA
jgi:hypothetical protein